MDPTHYDITGRSVDTPDELVCRFVLIRSDSPKAVATKYVNKFLGYINK